MMTDFTAWASSAGAVARKRGLPDHITMKVSLSAYSRGGCVLDFDSDHVIAQFVVWPSGATEGSAIKVATEAQTFWHGQVSGIEELDKAFADFLRAIVEL
jgi:hypothetical protein